MATEPVRIVEAHAPPWLASARTLFEEYAASIGIDLSFQGFDAELATLPGDYVPPRGRLLLALYEDAPVGCVALRPLEAGVCEMKRLYVRPGFRGLRVGRLLVERLIDEARRAGYASMRLDTLPSMNEARVLYESLGFRRIGAYCENPLPGAMFLELALRDSAASPREDRPPG